MILGQQKENTWCIVSEKKVWAQNRVIYHMIKLPYLLIVISKHLTVDITEKH